MLLSVKGGYVLFSSLFTHFFWAKVVVGFIQRRHKNHWAVLSRCRARPAALLLRAGYTSPSSTRRVLGPRTTLETCLSILRSAPPVFLTYWEGKICLEPSLAVRAKGLIFSHNKAITPYFPRISARCNVTSPTTRRTWGLIVVFKTTLTTPMTSF